MSTNKYLILAIAVVVVVSGFSLFSIVRSSYYGSDSYIDSSLTVQGGAALNAGASPVANALIVYSGNVGIGDIVPSEEFVVTGEALFGASQSLRISDSGIEHYETSDAGGSTYTSTNYTCACLHIAELPNDQKGIAQANIGTSFMSVLEDVFSLSEANAAPSCYSTEADCQLIGCDYCVDEGTSCDPGEFACQLSCDDSYYGSPIDASCNTGDTELSYETGLCNGESVKKSVRCLSSTAYDDYFTKMEFLGSPEAGAPKRVIINDNIVAEGNVYGDGDSTNGSECAWETDDECDSNRFQAGYDNATDQIYCCEL